MERTASPGHQNLVVVRTALQVTEDVVEFRHFLILRVRLKLKHLTVGRYSPDQPGRILRQQKRMNLLIAVHNNDLCEIFSRTIVFIEA